MNKSESLGLSRALWILVVCGCLIGFLAFGIRSSFGLFVDPVSGNGADAFGFGREAFAFALAIQNLAWGVGQPLAGAIADRYGPWRVIAGGGVLFSLGLLTMTMASDPTSFTLTAGILVGLGMSGAGHNTVLAAFGQLLPPERRAWALGLGTATASLGQFLVVPLGQAFIEGYGWAGASVIMAIAVASTPLLALALRPRSLKAGETPKAVTPTTSTAPTLNVALGQAFGYNSYWLLLSGFFVCGFQLAFITVHLPPYLNDQGISASTASWAIALIGLFNVVGGYASGMLSSRMPRRMLLVYIYLARAIVTTAFLVLPLTNASTLVFGAFMGLLWLSTVPPTVQLVGVMFGNRFLSTLFGFVFLSHQVGAFVGVWAGGLLFARLGSYDLVWWGSVGLSIFAALVHLPIREKLYPRAAPTPTPSVA